MKNNDQAHDDSEEIPRPIFVVLLDDITAARLIEAADNAHDDPSNLIASILHDVFEDDALAHYNNPEAIKLQ